MKSKLILFLFMSAWGYAAPKTLHPEAFLKIVQTYHPQARQAQIGVLKSNAELLSARGGFDPILRHYSSQKTLDGKNYYEYHAPELNIPTWYGIELSAGSENLNGGRLDPSQTAGQTAYMGISIPLAKNLVIDKRRAALQQAKIGTQMAAQEQRLALNDLMNQAMEAYWNWAKSHRVLAIVETNVGIAKKRVEFVKRSVELGERPAVDTLEAFTQQQYFENMYQAKWVSYENARLELSVYLWKEGNVPMDLPSDVTPDGSLTDKTLYANFDLNLPSLLTKAQENHPALNAYTNKLEMLQIEKQLKFQSLLPKLDIQYNQLSKNGFALHGTGLLDNNFQYGIKFEMPLRLSQGRGDFQKAKLKLEEETLNRSQKDQQIQVKVRSYFNQFISLQKQVLTQEQAVANYQALVKAEEMRFQQGESSLFLINSRETKTMEAAEKLLDLQAYLFQSIYALQASAGVLM